MKKFLHEYAVPYTIKDQRSDSEQTEQLVQGRKSNTLQVTLVISNQLFNGYLSEG